MQNLKSFLEKETHASYIAGEEFSSKENHTVDFHSPVLQGPWKKIVPASKKETEYAISQAQRSFSIWNKVPIPERAEKLRKIASLLEENSDFLAEIMAMEIGKPVREGLLEVQYSAGFFKWFASEVEHLYGISIPSQYPNKNIKIIYEPVGVCGIITPWNFPLAMAARKIAAALAAGCSTVCKPSPETPFSMLLLARICEIAGIPKGCVNVLIGHEKEIGEALLNSFAVRKISFTGSTKTGKFLYEKSAQTIKKLTLELGGHAPLIVYDDADIEQAVNGTLLAKFRNNGQTCISANRILIQNGIYDNFLSLLLEKVKELNIGDPLSKETEISNILHPISVLKVQEHTLDAIAKGAEKHYLTDHPYEPKILGNITPGMKIFREETFGPIAPLMRFTNMDEAITLANASEYGLAAYVFTKDMKRANYTVSRLEYGIIGVNDGLPSAPQASFGGVKNSGLGREGGPSGIYEYLTEKFVSICFP